MFPKQKQWDTTITRYGHNIMLGVFLGNPMQGNVPQIPKFPSKPTQTGNLIFDSSVSSFIFSTKSYRSRRKSFFEKYPKNWSLQLANQIGEAIYLNQCQRIAWKSSQCWQTHRQSGTSLFILNIILNLGKGITINMAKDHKTRTRTANTVRIQIKHSGLHQFYYHSFCQLPYLKNPSQQSDRHTGNTP